MPNTVCLNIDSCIGDQSGRSTFETTTQHIVYSSVGGIFFGYYYTAYMSGTTPSMGYHRIVRCPVGSNPTVRGNWTTVYDSQSDDLQSHHLDLEVDDAGNLYVFGSVGDSATCHLWTHPTSNFANPTHRLYGFGSGKFSAIFDPFRKKLIACWWMAERPAFYLLNLDGSTSRTADLFHATSTSGHSMDAQYPVCGIGPNGLIVQAWICVDLSISQNYYADYFLLSTDGGATWTGKNGTAALPVNVDTTGSGWLVQETADNNEYVAVGAGGYGGNWNFLHSVAYNNGNLNFAYQGDSPTAHNMVRTFSYASKTWLTHQDLGLGNNGNGEVTFSQDETFTGTLYCQCWYPLASGACDFRTLTSTDGGLTWDAATSPFATSTFQPQHADVHYHSLARNLDPEGWLLGCFTLGGSIGKGSPVSTSQVYVTLTPVTGISPPPVVASFPTTTQLDNFNYVQNPLGGGNWTNNVLTAGGLQANGTTALSAANDGTYGGAAFTASRFTQAPVEAYVDVPTLPTTDTHRINLYWCNEAAANGDLTFWGYRIGFTNANGGQVYIDRIQGGTATTLGNPSALGTFVAGDGLGISIRADGTIEAYRRHSGTWTQVATANDVAPLWEAAPTPQLQYIGLATNDAGVRLDNFGGGGSTYPVTPVLDDFNYTASPLGGSWTSGVGTFSALRSDGQYAYASSAGAGNGSAALWTGTVWSAPPIEIYVDLPQVPATDPNWVGLYWASNQPVDSTHSHYRVAYDHSNGGRIEVYANINGVTGNVVYSHTNMGLLSAGDSFGVKFAEGGVISFYYKRGGTWMAVDTYTDPDPLWTLAINQPLRYIGVGTTDAAARLDNFGGGGISTVAPQTIAIPALVSG